VTPSDTIYHIEATLTLGSRPWKAVEGLQGSAIGHHSPTKISPLYVKNWLCSPGRPSSGPRCPSLSTLPHWMRSVGQRPRSHPFTLQPEVCGMLPYRNIPQLSMGPSHHSHLIFIFYGLCQ
jgi:hypothetical protein